MRLTIGQIVLDLELIAEATDLAIPIFCPTLSPDWLGGRSPEE
jgi:hypothetical protein